VLAKMPEPSPRASSRTAIFLIELAYLLALGAFVIAYRIHWIDPRKDFFGPVPFLVPWFGAVGAAVLSLSGVFAHRRDWDVEYRFWHWSRPLIGGIVGTVSVLIFQSGILAVGSKLPSQTATTTTKNLLYYVVAFVVGYREDIFRQLIRRLADVILTPASEPAAAAPVIESIQPPQTIAGTQTEVKVNGSGFTGATAVTLGGDSVQFISESDTELTVTIPAAAPARPTSLVVTTKYGSATAPFTIA
jgi:IPT/TIG domain